MNHVSLDECIDERDDAVETLPLQEIEVGVSLRRPDQARMNLLAFGLCLNK